jgi:hypothetical protein
MADAGESADDMARELRDRARGLRAKADELEGRADRSEIGAEGERRVAAVLAPLESPSCRVLHDRLLDPSTSRVNLDHIVVSVAGIFVVDAKNWAGDVVEFEGSLWQHKFGPAGKRISVPMNPEVNKVRRMAEQVETVATRVVEPVVCLTGDNADRFGPARSIRGVSVVPLGELAAWLLSRPRATESRDVATEAVRLSAFFPPAGRSVLLGADEPAESPRPQAKRTTPIRRSAPTPRKRASSARPRARRSGRRKASPWAAVASIVAMLAFAVLAAKLIASASHRASKALTQAATNHAAAWVEPCSAVTDAVVAKSVGRPVFKYQTGSQDTCLWGYQPRPNPYAPADISVKTGWFARADWPKPAQAVDYDHEAGLEAIWVPQFVAVPGSAIPAAHITQPISVTVLSKGRYGASIAPVTARRAALQLAQEVAKHMPTGPGAADIKYRYN